MILTTAATWPCQWLTEGAPFNSESNTIFLSLFLYRHVECSEVQSYLCGEDPLPLPRASAVVIREILSMYRDILAFLYSVVKLNTIFCFNLLQDEEALDRIVLLFSLEASLAGKVLVQSSSYCFRRQLVRFWPMSRDTKHFHCMLSTEQLPTTLTVLFSTPEYNWVTPTVNR